MQRPDRHAEFSLVAQYAVLGWPGGVRVVKFDAELGGTTISIVGSSRMTRVASATPLTLSARRWNGVTGDVNGKSLSSSP